MNELGTASIHGVVPPRRFGLGVALLCALGLCSCRGPATTAGGRMPAPGDATGSARATDLPGTAAAEDDAPGAIRLTSATESLGPSAATGSASAAGPGSASAGATGFASAAGPLCPPGMEQGVPLAYQPVSAWTPPGITQPWPANEYLRDGGDQGMPAGVDRSGRVHGLEVEDTVAHFDTLDGRTLVEPSNEVYLYAPRFGAVRRVDNLVAGQQALGPRGVDTPVKLAGSEELDKVHARQQNIQARRETSASAANAYLSRQGDGIVSSQLGPKDFSSAFQAYENVSVIRTGQMREAEMPFLAKAAIAAQLWTRNAGVQVMLGGQAANAAVCNERAETVYTVNRPPANPKLRVIKVASTQLALPGDTVDFTIRYDNVGNQPIGNVTILDNLTPRLEYLPKTAQSSLDARFYTTPNPEGSVVLHWEIAQPLAPDKGGVVRFTCRVR